MTIKPARGVIRGKSIELAEDLGLVEGQEVEVIVRVRAAESPQGRGLLRPAGGMAPRWTPEDDLILAEIEQGRGRPSMREISTGCPASGLRIG